MDPLTLALLTGGGAAGTLLGGRKEITADQLNQLFGTGALAKKTNDLFALLASSPAFRSALSQTNIAGQQAGQKINANLARAGLLDTGVGAVGSALGESAGGFSIADLIGQLQNSALTGASGLNSQLLNAFINTRQTGPTPLQNASSSVLGAVAPSWLRRRPAGGANSVPSSGEMIDTPLQFNYEPPKA